MGKKRWYWFGLAGLLGLAGIGSASIEGPLPVTSLPLEPELTVSLPATPGLRTFSAGGHVLGFGPQYLLTAMGSHALKVEFLNANTVMPRSDTSDGEHQQQKIPPLTEVRYPGLWDGIDLSYRTAPGGIAESVYQLQPGADINQVRLRYNRPLSLNADGSLSLRFDTGLLTESAPIAWQELDGKHRPVTVAFVQHNAQELGFALGDYDPTRPLWIDPTLTWNTFFGSGSSDYVYGIALDGSGNVYVTGHSYSTWGIPRRAYSGKTDAFVAKLDTNGTLLWNTFLGGSDTDHGRSIAVDGSGNVYVTGYSDVTWGNPLRAHVGGWPDAFVAKLNTNGTLLWNTFLGGNSSDEGYGIALDSSGNAYVTGESHGTWGNPLNPYSGGGDAFIAKLAPNGTLLWNTFLLSSDFGSGIALDSSSNVYVTGSYGSNSNAFVAKLSVNGALLWHALLGGSKDDYGRGIAVDDSGNVYVTGESQATWGNPLRTFVSGSNAATNAFVAKLSTNGALLWNTFLGGSDSDYGYGIVVDGRGSVFVTGTSYATWGNPLWEYSRLDDAFVAKLSTNGALLWNTFLGGKGNDYGYGIAADGGGNLYVTGSSTATWDTPLQAHNGSYDVFVAKLSDALPTHTSRTDLDGDGQADILWRNSATGENWLYLMNGNNIQASEGINRVPDQNWKIAGVADFDGDGKADILWRNSVTGEIWLYQMDGAVIQESNPINRVADLSWKIAGVGDFDGDGQADILWRNSVTGENWLYLMEGNNIQASEGINRVPDQNWKIVGVADFDGDGQADILWRNSVTGENWLYQMDGAVIQESNPIDRVADLTWKIAGLGDFDGDGQADILWRNSATGENSLYLMDGNNIQASEGINRVPDQNWKIVGVDDFDGDGKVDILWRNASTGGNWLYLMDSASIQGSQPINTVADQNWKVQGGGVN